MKKTLSLFIIFFLCTTILFAQTDTTKQTTNKTGWKFGGALPAIAYDTDTGFKYGAIGYIYDWGDGTLYPDYLRSIYLEATYTTKRSGIFRVIFDDKKFFNTKIRFMGDAAFYTERALDFYGFNGYEAKYNSIWENETIDDVINDEYISRVYFRHQRFLLRGIADFQYPFLDDKLRIIGGYSFYGIDISPVDVDNLNKGKDDDKKLPPIADSTNLFQYYVDNGIIKNDQKDGGLIHHFKAGVIWDSRDNEAMPMRGIWSEVLFIGSPALGSNNYGYTQLVATHRQYFTIIKKRMSFVYRLVYSTKLSGEMPFYMLPFYQNTKEIRDGFGGSKTIRGVLRNRVVGDGVAFGNIEWRWRFLNTKIFNQDFYIAISAFADAGYVTQQYDFNKANIPNYNTNELFGTKENIHLGYGGGIRFALNENFILAVDYGLAHEKQDGKSGLYIGLGWL